MVVVAGAGNSYQLAGVGEVDTNGHPVADGHNYPTFVQPTTGVPAVAPSGVPTIKALENLGSGGKASLASGATNVSGSINLVSDSGASAGDWVTVTFSAAFPVVPNVVPSTNGIWFNAGEVLISIDNVSLTGFSFSFSFVTPNGTPTFPPQGLQFSVGYTATVRGSAPGAALIIPAGAVVNLDEMDGIGFIMGQLH